MAGAGNTEKAFLESLAKHDKETQRLYSNPYRTERERMVVRAFLRCVGIRFSDNEILPGKIEPVDVAFRSARFQIVEMLGGRKRGDVLRERRLRIEAAKSIADVMEPWSHSKPLSFAELTQKLTETLFGKASKYGPRGCAELDALIYVDLAGRHLYPLDGTLDVAGAASLHQQGWRSVSVLFVPYGIVVLANRSCPSFLRKRVGSIFNKWSLADGWFDP